MSPSNRSLFNRSHRPPHRPRVFQLVIGAAVLVAASIATATSWPGKESEVSTVTREPAGLSEREIALRRQMKTTEIAAKAAAASLGGAAARGESKSAASQKAGSWPATIGGAAASASPAPEGVRAIPVDTTPRKLSEISTIVVGPDGLSDLERAKAAAAESGR